MIPLAGLPLAGIILSAGLALIASSASRRMPSFYDGEIYNMTPQTHQRMASTALFLVAVFILADVIPQIPAAFILACTTLGAILYLASFVRGAEEEQ